VNSQAFSEPLPPTDRTTLRRKKDRGHFDRATINAILDEGLICHVGFSVEQSPFVIPMIHTRIGDVLYLHGAAANRTLRSMTDGATACVTVTVVDGLVLARSSFHHSLNYRSVMLFGQLRRVVDDDEQLAVAAALLEHLLAGRSRDPRPPSPAERKATAIVALPITEGSAKIRRGGPVEEPEDLALDVWAGVLPVSQVIGTAEPDSALLDTTAVPDYVTRASGTAR
jgi:uncharacterized protein